MPASRAERAAIAHVVQRLSAQFSMLDAAVVQRVVRDTHRRFADHPTREFVPILVSAGMLPSSHATTCTPIVRMAFVDTVDTVEGHEHLARISVECLQRHPSGREEVLAKGDKAPRREWEHAT